MNIYSLVSLITSIIFFSLANFIFYKNDKNKSNIILTVILLLNSVWTFAEFVYRQTGSQATADFWLNISSAWIYIPSLFTHFILSFTKKAVKLSKKVLFTLLYFPSTLFLIIDIFTEYLTGPPVYKYWGWTYSLPEFNIILLSGIIWTYGLTIYALISGLIALHRDFNEDKKQQLKFIITGIAIPLILGIITEVIFPPMKIEIPELASLFVLFGHLIIVYGIWKHRIFSFDQKVTSEILMSPAANIIFLCNNQKKIVLSNKAAQALSQYNERELSQLSIGDLFEDISKYFSAKPQFHYTMLQHIETDLITKKGVHIPIAISISSIHNKSQKETGIIIVGNDISNQKKIEATLAENQKRYQLATSAGKVGVWEWNFKTRQFYLDLSLKYILGYDDFEIQNRLDDWLQLVHPEDISKIKNKANAFIRGEIPLFKIEHRMILKSRDVRWFLTYGSLIKNSNNEPVSLIGTSSDISERKNFEFEIKKAHDELEKRVIHRTLELTKSNSLLHKEIESHQRTVAKSNQYIKDLQFLSQSIVEIVGLPPEEDPYRFIATKLQLLIKDAIILVNTYDKKSDTICVHTIEGIRQVTHKIMSILGKNPIDFKIKLNDEQAKAEIISGKLTQIVGGLYSLTLKQIPKPACQLIENLLNIGEIYGMGFSRNGELYGNTIILTKKDSPLFNKSIIETVINQFAIALQRYQAEKEIKSSLAEKDILLNEIHHRVKNNLQIISSLFYLQSKKIADQKTRQIFDDFQNRVKAMALIHETLYDSKNFSQIDFADYIKRLANYVYRLYKIDSKNIILNQDIENIFLNIDFSINCGFIINELLTNSIKHAFLATNKGIINIQLFSDNDTLTLIYQDNGVGIPNSINFQNTNTLGLQLVNAITNQLSGTVDLERNQGLTFRFRFKITK